jgi:hypothetical protein
VSSEFEEVIGRCSGWERRMNAKKPKCREMFP